MNTKIKKQRARALAAIDRALVNDNYLPIDYLIDTEARRVLNLPERPDGNLPYVGWLMIDDGNSNQGLRLSKDGRSFIRNKEGLRLKAYQCQANVWTIGFGHTKSAKPGQKIDIITAQKLFNEDVRVFEDAVNQLVTVPLNQNQYDSLVSFAFNIGVGAFKSSTLLEVLNQGKYDLAAKEFLRWIYASGRRNQGLINRRKAEKELFKS